MTVTLDNRIRKLEGTMRICDQSGRVHIVLTPYDPTDASSIIEMAERCGLRSSRPHQNEVSANDVIIEIMAVPAGLFFDADGKLTKHEELL